MSDNNRKLNFLLTYWCHDENYDYVADLQRAYDTGKYDTVAGQIEEGDKNHGIHVQGYVKLRTKSTGKSVLKDFPSGYNFTEEIDPELAKDPLNAPWRMQEYATKEKGRISKTFTLLGEHQRDRRTEHNKKGGESTKRKWDDIKELAIKEDWDAIGFDVLAKHVNGIRTAANLIIQQRERLADTRELLPDTGYILELKYKPFRLLKLVVCRDRAIKDRHYWIYSKPDYGKSTAIEKMLKIYKGHIINGASDVYKYWNTWQGEIDIFCIDEFKQGTMSHDMLTTLCNRNTTTRVCGLGNGKTNINCVIILSNYTIEECYPFMHEPVSARFQFINLHDMCMPYK